MEIDTIGTFAMSRAAFPALRQRGGGRIVNISATLHYGATWWQVGCSCRVFLHGDHRSFSMALAPRNNRSCPWPGAFVISVGPGLAVTNAVISQTSAQQGEASRLFGADCMDAILPARSGIKMNLLKHAGTCICCQGGGRQPDKEPGARVGGFWGLRQWHSARADGRHCRSERSIPSHQPLILTAPHLLYRYAALRETQLPSFIAGACRALPLAFMHQQPGPGLHIQNSSHCVALRERGHCRVVQAGGRRCIRGGGQ